MFIQTEDTPNPNTIKFIPGETVLGQGRTAQFNQLSDAKNSPLATALFGNENVKSVFLGADFISITKSKEADWSLIKTDLLTVIMDHYVTLQPIMNEETDIISNEAEDDISKQIRELVETRVRPAVAQDGGDIIFRGFDDGVVMLELHGACSGCPSSTVTLKDGIENMLKHYIPEVERVEAVNP